jgi:hypothetical protein
MVSLLLSAYAAALILGGLGIVVAALMPTLRCTIRAPWSPPVPS